MQPKAENTILSNYRRNSDERHAGPEKETSARLDRVMINTLGRCAVIDNLVFSRLEN